MVVDRKFSSRLGIVLITGALLSGLGCAPADDTIDVERLLEEMVDFENLAQRPEPFFKQATASSYSRESHKGGDAWFHNLDRGHYVRTEANDGRKEHVLADLKAWVECGKDFDRFSREERYPID